MPRKSTGGASASGGASTPGTPVSKAPRKSHNGTSSTTEAEPLLTIPASTKLVVKQQETALKGIDSFELPRSNIVKCAKTDLPDSVQLRKEVQQALVKSATVFISYLTATAHDHARKRAGKIIGPQHVLDALRELGFSDDELGSIKAELKTYRENVARKKSDKVAGEKKDTAEAEETDEGGGNDADVSRMDGDEADSRIDESLAEEQQDQLMDQD